VRLADNIRKLKCLFLYHLQRNPSGFLALSEAISECLQFTDSEGDRFAALSSKDDENGSCKILSPTSRTKEKIS